MRTGLTVFMDLPWSIAAGWIVFLVWSALQLVWYRRAHVVAEAAVQPSAPPRRILARVPRRQKAADMMADALPPIDLDSIADTRVIAPTQTVLGL